MQRLLSEVKDTSDKLYYKKQGQLLIIGFTAQEQRLLSEVKDTSDKLYYYTDEKGEKHQKWKTCQDDTKAKRRKADTPNQQGNGTQCLCFCLLHEIWGNLRIDRVSVDTMVRYIFQMRTLQMMIHTF